MATKEDTKSTNAASMDPILKDTTADNATTSIARPATTLLSLPAELRVQILQHAILAGFPDFNVYDHYSNPYKLPDVRSTCRTLRGEAQTAFLKCLCIESKYLEALEAMIEEASLAALLQWEVDTGMHVPPNLKTFQDDVRVMQHRAMMLMWR